MAVVFKFIFYSLLFFSFGCGKIGEKAKFFQAKDSRDVFVLDQKTQPHRVDVFQQNFLINPWSTETFTQKLHEKKMQVDIVWVIDDSASMYDNQVALANNFKTFVEVFSRFTIDFRMAVITTTHSTNYDIEEKLNSKFLKSNKQGFIELFKEKVKVGTSGSGFELGLSKSKEFFSGNPDWINTDNYLVIIFLSDENDHGIDSVRSYVDWIARKKEGLESVKIYSIVSMTQHQDQGTRYIEAARLTRGLSRDIGSKFDDVLNTFSNDIVKLVGQNFKLSQTFDISRVDEAEVFVNGTLVNRNTWLFSSKLNSIRFINSAAVSDGSKVKVVYPDTRSVGNLLSSFTLSEKLDTESPNLRVRVNNIEVSSDKWNIDNATKTITFSSGFVPDSGAKIEISYRPYREKEPKYMFKLTRKADPNKLDMVDVFLNGEKIDSIHWTYNSEKNSIIFKDDEYPINIGDKIEIVYTDKWKL